NRYARQMGCSLEFIPVHKITEAQDWLNTGSADVLMSLISLTPANANKFALSSPVLSLPVGLIVKDHDRQQFQRWDDIRKIRNLRVAIVDTPVARNYLTNQLPNATPVFYQNRGELEEILASGLTNADAIGIFAEEGAAWTILYPQYTLVAPSPPVFAPVGYAVARGDADMLVSLNTWLLDARSEDTIDELYRYWMLGQVRETQPPRWSIIHDVLGWTD
ncbi:MAG TPA: transporter substrate-binding domain-containing protein, partial [Verrucomicrobiae bacterium]|nr:transporter substrate-binding domain-containing protein [Verrucomicrobiae bacterium]